MKISMVLTFLMFAIQGLAHPELESKYTSVKPADCFAANSSELELEPEIDFYEGTCPAFGGYVVEISGGDIRYSLSLHYGKKKIDLPRPGAFHDMGSDVIEWRFNRHNSNGHGPFHPNALIYRLNVADDLTEGPKNIDRLIVVRLNKEKSCVIGDLSKVKDMNKKARAIADDFSSPCL
ncbi:MAG: hypothetical protein AAF203_05530 [Pseudomonadota bacterium]